MSSLGPVRFLGNDRQRDAATEASWKLRVQPPEPTTLVAEDRRDVLLSPRHVAMSAGYFSVPESIDLFRELPCVIPYVSSRVGFLSFQSRPIRDWKVLQGMLLCLLR